MIILGRQVLIEPKLKEESVIITSDKPELTDRAIVLDYGQEVGRDIIHKGDKVLFNNRAGTPVKLDGKDLILTDIVNIYIVL